MESGNSGSLQSSSGGDDEYDSRAAADHSISAFINNPISHPPPQSQPPFFDPFSNYLNLNPNMAWPGATLRPDPNPVPAFTPSFHKRPAAFGVENDNNVPGGSATTQHNQNQTAAARNPKKRSRASRRAPTTVLTTDTSNFRAMVQEFTGIPAQPFHNNISPFTRTRFDLYGGGSATLDAPPYLRRPFAQKVQSPMPFLTANSNYQLQTPHENSNPFNNINNQIDQTPLLLNSLLQTNPKFPFSNSSIMASKSDQNSFGLSIQGQASSSSINGGLQTLISSDHQNALRNVQKDNNDLVNREENNNDNGDRVKNIMIMNSQMNESAWNFNGEKSPENVAGKGEGNMVESWICSSEYK